MSIYKKFSFNFSEFSVFPGYKIRAYKRGS